MQELAAFLNTDGGYLFIGIEDKTKKLLGLEADYESFTTKPNERNRDGFERHLRTRLQMSLGRHANC